MTEKTEYIKGSIDILEARDELNADELAVLCNLKKFMHQSDTPPFAVGEYYVILNVIYKVTELAGDTVNVLSLHPATGELCKESFKLSTATEHTDKPATTEQIATFKRAEIKNDVDIIIKNGDADWIEIVEDIEDYLAEELQEVGYDSV